MSLKHIIGGASIGLVLLLAVSAGGRAQAATAPKSSQAQVDGIVSAVVTRLWDHNDVYWHQGDYPRIIAVDRIITQADPHFVDCYNTGAWLMWSDGHDSDAEAFYQQGVANNPRDSAAYYDYGVFLFNHRKEYAKAVQAYTRDTQRADAGILDWRMLAHSYEKAGKWQQAVDTWRAIQKRWPIGVKNDPTSAAVDANNLKRALSHLNSAAPLGSAAPAAVIPAQ